MNTAVTVIAAVLVFGFLIFIHEFGHYITARIFKVSITEFSIGMGPRLLWYDSKKTGIRYSLAMFPIGGYVAMVGEDEESDDPNAFNKKPAWQRFIITAAGATVNIVAGFLAMIVLVSMIKIGGTTVGAVVGPEGFVDPSGIDFTEANVEEKLLPGDVITRVNGKRVVIRDELAYEVMRNGNEPVSLTVKRGTEEITLENVIFPKAVEQDQEFGVLNVAVVGTEKNVGQVLKYSFRNSFLNVRMVWESLYDLIRGRYSFAAVSGPVGISGAIGEAAEAGPESFLNIVIMISINLGVMNLLPIPALDGGRLLVILAEMVSGKKLPPKVEAMINGIGLLLLLGLSAVIMVKDIVQLF